MKPAARLLFGSLALNGALLATFTFHPALRSTTMRDLFAPAVRSASAQTPATSPSRTEVGDTKAKVGRAENFWRTLDTTDLATFVRNLQAAGFSHAMVREMTWVRIHAGVEARIQGDAIRAANAPFWKPLPLASADDGSHGFYSDPPRLFRQVVPPELWETRPTRPRPLGELPPSKSDVIARIDRDYEELRRKLRDDTREVELAEDREKGAMLTRARRADIVAALTPGELEVYDMSRWSMTRRVTESLSFMNGTEEEFVTIFRIHRPFTEILETFRTPDATRKRMEAEQQIAAQLKASLGDSRYADYVRSSNQDFQAIDRLAARADLPREAAIDAFNLRTAAASESSRIFADPNQSVAQKRIALQTHAAEIKTRLVALIGSDLAEKYTETNGWLSHLERGGAIELDAKGNSSSP